MRRALLSLVIALALSLAAGCGSVGKNFDSGKVQNIKNHSTTKNEVLDWFGLPFKEGMENGSMMWTYQFDRYVAGSTKSKDLVILFDNNNVVKAYRYTSNE
ncbi:MAG: hypothetical protein HY580_02990 [Nitrospinae bacterium]|nr:hypothetical protein [Nitrospinota bacterium]